MRAQPTSAAMRLRAPAEGVEAHYDGDVVGRVHGLPIDWRRGPRRNGERWRAVWRAGERWDRGERIGHEQSLPSEVTRERSETRVVRGSRSHVARQRVSGLPGHGAARPPMWYGPNLRPPWRPVCPPLSYYHGARFRAGARGRSGPTWPAPPDPHGPCCISTVSELRYLEPNCRTCLQRGFGATTSRL